MLESRRTKIVCTIGPASQNEDRLRELVGAGMNVARLNMSHGTRARHAEVVDRLRRVSAELGQPVAILLDLSGPKIRLGELAAPLFLTPGERVTLTIENVRGEGDLLPVSYPGLVEELGPGDRLSMADGLVELEVLAVEPPRLTAEVLSEGTVSSHKGVNLPSAALGLPAMTAKDHEDLRFGLEVGVDWVALSFVRRASDVEVPRAVMTAAGRQIPVLAKIEKPQAVEVLDDIIAAFDGLMVARGDLGVEVPLESVPGLQKKIIARANSAAKPVITATQMLLSMVESPRPTRAEATDVANAILDGSDGLMLSEETAMGAHPVRAVETMVRIAAEAEALRHEIDRPPVGGTTGELPAAIAHATWEVAALTGARAIVTPTSSGSTARLVAATRPPVPILALPLEESIVRQLCLTWGVIPRRIGHADNSGELFEICRQKVLECGLASPGDHVVVTLGLPLEQAGTTNLLRILEI
jgi:pyruvate kinase